MLDELNKIAKEIEAISLFNQGDRVRDIFSDDDEYFMSGTVVNHKPPYIKVRFDNGHISILRDFHFKRI